MSVSTEMRPAALEGKRTLGKLRWPFAERWLVILLMVAYVAGAAVASTKIILHARASTDAIEKIFDAYSMKNEGEQAVDRYAKQHPLLGFFMESPVKNEMELPSHEESSEALTSGVAHDLRAVRNEASIAAWWSWFLVSLSLFYFVTMVSLERSFTTRPVIFALTSISVGFFLIGVIAPAMVIWTAPTIPMQSGNFEFVLQHQVRGIGAIIWELLTGGHLIIGGFLLLFSIITPLTKASLTFFATACRSKSINARIGNLLHTIGKWSMADVFVAAVLLALYALKYQQATKSIPCIGLYYFIGYCLLSMSTTELMSRSGLVSGNEPKAKERLGLGMISGLYVGLVCFVIALSGYTYEQYTVNTKQKITASSVPSKLNNADLVLPVHK
jgi:paraquat-inducible protein A